MSAERAQGNWLKVFCPDARCLTEAEIASLPEEKKAIMKDRNGLWLDIFCPDGSCASGPEHFWGQAENGVDGVWLKTFCPDDACLAEQATDVP